MLDRLRACIIASYYSRAGQPLAQVTFELINFLEIKMKILPSLHKGN